MSKLLRNGIMWEFVRYSEYRNESKKITKTIFFFVKNTHPIDVLSVRRKQLQGMTLSIKNI